MAIPEFELRRVSALLQRFCERRVPVHVRHQVQLEFSVRGSAITLFERRPRSTNPAQWIESGVARFRYNAKGGAWALYYRDRNSKWHSYQRCEPTKQFEALLREVVADPTGIFWG